MNIDSRRFLIIIAGPTAVGKTSVTIRLARYFHFPVISADSRQFYREMQIGTARPGSGELSEIPYYLSGHLSIHDPYNVSMFEKDALHLLDDLFTSFPAAILSGGSGLFIDAVCRGMDELPDPDPELRSELRGILAREGVRPLQEKLKKLDPVYYSRVDLNNPMRLLRAVEVCLITGVPYSALRGNRPAKRSFQPVKLCLALPREELNERINSRTDEMINEGFFEEARQLYPFRNLNALNTVGYKELFAVLDNRISLEEAIVKIKTNTRRYAKRQMTWFSRDPEYQWFHPGDLDGMINYIDLKMKL